MKKTLSLLMLGGILAFAACGPSEAEKKAAAQKTADSIAAVEKAKMDSITAATEAEAAAKIAEAEAKAAAAQQELKGAKAAAKDAKAEVAAAKAKADADAKAKADAEKAAAEKKAAGGKLLNKTGGTQQGTEVKPAEKTGKLKNKMN